MVTDFSMFSSRHQLSGSYLYSCEQKIKILPHIATVPARCRFSTCHEKSGQIEPYLIFGQYLNRKLDLAGKI